MWQDVASHGRQEFQNLADLEIRMEEVERALTALCLGFAKVSSDTLRSGLVRALDLRAKPARKKGKSLYEGLNQLIHYWYCCAAAKYLLAQGCIELVVHPTGHDSGSKETPNYDIAAKTSDGMSLIAEVFCVSSGLFNSKVGKTLEKFDKADDTVHRIIFHNQVDGRTLGARSRELYVFSIEAESGQVTPVLCTESRPRLHFWPAAAGR